MFTPVTKLYTRVILSLYIYVLTTTSSHAATLKDLIIKLADSLGSVPTLLAIICYILGLILVISGFAYCNKAKNFPQQAEMSTGVWRIIIGAALLALPTIINAMTGSLGTAAPTITKPVF